MLIDDIVTVDGAATSIVKTLTSTAGVVAVDLARGNCFTLTLTENTTLAAPTNAVAGQTGHIRIIQNATTARTLAFNTAWKAATGTAGVMPVTLGASVVMSYIVEVGGATPVIVYGWATKGAA